VPQTVYVQAVMVRRWFKEATDIRVLARDAGISIATAYRYLHEGIDVIATHAPDLPDVLAKGHREDWGFVCLDGTLIATDRCSAKSETGHDLWYSGKHKQHGGNVQVVCDPTGYPVWVSLAEPGSTHDITCARIHALGALYKAAADGLPTLTDKGYVGAGIGIIVPTKGHNLAADNQTRNQLITALRARRTRQRAAQADLESPASHHSRPGQNHQHHRRSTRPATPSTSGLSQIPVAHAA
jgi:hypothetical protein